MSSIHCGGRFDLPVKEDRLRALEVTSQRDTFWDSPQAAQETLKELEALKSIFNDWQRIDAVIGDVDASLELLRLEPEAGLEAELAGQLDELAGYVEKLRFQKMLSGPEDASAAIMTINAGAGGTESCDWAGMLMRMYLRYCEKKSWPTEIADISDGDQAGIKSVTFLVNGPYAYGRLKAENGVHRLVRISPFDANKRRHTSFASVFVMPQVEDDVDIEINENDLKVDTFRAGGAGGQHVNKTDSAVRMTHIPTGIVVQCQNERSQHKNRATAMKMLRAKLYEQEMEKKRVELAETESQKKRIEWGSQIRSYVLQPYQLVKDLRSSYETGNVQAILDGDLDEMITAYLLSA